MILPSLDKANPFKRACYVLHVKPRTEKRVFSFLEGWGYTRYLPLLTKIRKIQRRKVRTELPLFPGYVFTALTPDERMNVLKTNLIVHFIPVPHPRELVHQLRQVMHVSRKVETLRMVPVFKEGQLVRIARGPFYGVEAYVKRDVGGTTITVNVDLLGQAVEVTINPEDVETSSGG